MTRQGDRAISTASRPRPRREDDLAPLVQAHLDGVATDAELTTLEQDESAWIAALERLLDDTERSLSRVRANVDGPEKDLVIADFEDERSRILEQLDELDAQTSSGDDRDDEDEDVSADDASDEDISSDDVSDEDSDLDDASDDDASTSYDDDLDEDSDDESDEDSRSDDEDSYSDDESDDDSDSQDESEDDDSDASEDDSDSASDDESEDASGDDSDDDASTSEEDRDQRPAARTRATRGDTQNEPRTRARTRARAATSGSSDDDDSTRRRTRQRSREDARTRPRDGDDQDTTERTESPSRTDQAARSRARRDRPGADRQRGGRDGQKQSDDRPDTRRDRDRADDQQKRSRDDAPKAEAERDEGPPGTPQLQLSWDSGRLLAWAGGHRAPNDEAKVVLERLGTAGADPAAWTPADPMNLPDGSAAETVAATVGQTLGWLVSLAATAKDETLGLSATWLGHVAALGTRLVAQGRMVPTLDRTAKNTGKGKGGGRGTFRVRWMPALVDHDELTSLSRAMPGVVSLTQGRKDRRAVTMDVLEAFIDAICSDAAARIEVPAPPPDPRNASDVAETVLARLGGQEFDAPNQHGVEIGRGMTKWARSVSGAPKLRLVVQLDPPDDVGAWHLKVLVPGGQRKHERVDAAMSNASQDRRENIKAELERLESLFPRLSPESGRRRGEVLLGQDEAWELMTTTGSVLHAAGFDVRVPPLKRKKAKPGLRVTSNESSESVVGAHQLSTVTWSAVFDDVELTADEIQRLASESRPLVKSHGRWVEVDHADLEAAAAALAEREKQDQLTGADMLRMALGLDDSPLAGGFSVAGKGWAADLLRSAGDIPEDPPTSPEGFEGELRGYQADALAWLDFLDGAGLGGCLALDMGLGKTPTMLAHLQLSKDRGHGPSLVIAPPAVVGNWASEARRFVPDLKVVVHHGQNRAGASEMASEVANADLIITTYGTAVRDIPELEDVAWGKVVLDEAQVIKNPTSETAVELRRLKARTRVVLTGTPIENGLGDLWALLDFVNPGLVGDRATFLAQMQRDADGEKKERGEQALRTLNGVLVFRRTKAEPSIAAELPDRIDELDHCPMTAEQVGLYQAVLDELVLNQESEEGDKKKGAVLAAITALKQICNHPAAYTGDDEPLEGRSGKLARLEEIVDNVFEAGERVLIFTHFASWGERLAEHLSKRTGTDVGCYHGGLARGARDKMIKAFQEGEGAGALVLSLKAGGTGLNLTAASHVVLYDRWWNPAVEDQARDRAWRIGQTKTVVAHRLVCPGTVDERVEEVVQGKRRIADIALPKSSSVGDLDTDQLRTALGIDPDMVLTDDTLSQEASV